MHDEAAKVIAEAFPASGRWVSEDYLDARLAKTETRILRWVVTLMATQWLGFAAMIVADVLSG